MTHLIYLYIGWVGIHAEWRGTQQFPVLYWLYIIYSTISYILCIVTTTIFFTWQISSVTFYIFLVKSLWGIMTWQKCDHIITLLKISDLNIPYYVSRQCTVMFCRYRCFCVLVIKCKNLLMSIMFLLHLKIMYNSATFERLKSRMLPMWCMTIFGGGSHQAKRSEREVTVFSDQQRKQDRDDEGDSD